MPTKKRKERKRELEVLMAEVEQKKHLLDKFPLERLGGGVTPCIVVDSTGELVLHPKTGLGGNKSRSEDRIDRIKDLKRIYADIWRDRSAAKKIASETGYDERTIQKYIKDYP